MVLLSNSYHVRRRQRQYKIKIPEDAEDIGWTSYRHQRAPLVRHRDALHSHATGRTKR